MRQVAPLAAGPGLVQDRVHDLPHLVAAPVPADRGMPRLPRRYHRLDQRPPVVGQVTGVRLTLAHTASPLHPDRASTLCHEILTLRDSRSRAIPIKTSSEEACHSITAFPSPMAIGSCFPWDVFRGTGMRIGRATSTRDAGQPRHPVSQGEERTLDRRSPPITYGDRPCCGDRKGCICAAARQAPAGAYGWYGGAWRAVLGLASRRRSGPAKRGKFTIISFLRVEARSWGRLISMHGMAKVWVQAKPIQV